MGDAERIRTIVERYETAERKHGEAHAAMEASLEDADRAKDAHMRQREKGVTGGPTAREWIEKTRLAVLAVSAAKVALVELNAATSEAHPFIMPLPACGLPFGTTPGDDRDGAGDSASTENPPAGKVSGKAGARSGAAAGG